MISGAAHGDTKLAEAMYGVPLVIAVIEVTTSTQSGGHHEAICLGLGRWSDTGVVVVAVVIVVVVAAGAGDAAVVVVRPTMIGFGIDATVLCFSYLILPKQRISCASHKRKKTYCKYIQEKDLYALLQLL